MTFDAGDPATGRFRFRIDRVVPAPAAPGAPTWYDVSVPGERASRSSAPPIRPHDGACGARVLGRGRQLRAPRAGPFAFACTAGDQAKCVRFG
jgi:hypothetical protein